MNRSQVRDDCHFVLNGRTDALEGLRGQTVLITGGTGFMGTWLAEALVCLNDDFNFGVKIALLARGTDRFATTHPHLATRRDVRLIRSDIRYISEVPRETNWIIHAAGTPDNRFHASRPVETMSTIVEGTANLIRTLDPLSDFRKLLFLSSGYIYGSQPWDLPAIPETFESAPVLGSSASAYSEAKRCAETFCASARSEKRLPIVVARPFAFIGPYQSLNTPWAANNFLLDALSNRSIRIQGDGETVRSYMYGADAAYWILKILTTDEPGHAWNLGSPQAVTLKEFAEIVASSVSPAPDIRLHAATHGNTPRTRFVPDVSAAQKKLGLDLKFALKEAVEKTIRWNQSQATPAGTLK